jgi:hypothetical protein
LRVLVDGEQVLDARPVAFLGILPEVRAIREAVTKPTT